MELITVVLLNVVKLFSNYLGFLLMLLITAAFSL